MPDVTHLAKAQLRELDANFTNEINPENWLTIQFNPETLQVSLANSVVTPEGGGSQTGTPTMQFVGAGTTQLTAQAWFDVTVPSFAGASGDPLAAGGAAQASMGMASLGQIDDVSKLTQKVAFFITPKQDAQDPNKFIPPAVRFLWGAFQFDGIMNSLNESFEFFSHDGRPLRASVTFTLAQQKIQHFTTNTASASAGSSPATSGTGTTPLVQAPAGSTLQSIVDREGRGANWQAIAAANGIENPRHLRPGQFIRTTIAAVGQARRLR